MEKLQKLLQDKENASWEIGFRDYVHTGKVAIDDFLWEWLYERIEWPDEDFSIFSKDNIYVQTNFLGVNIVIRTGDENQRRFVHTAMFVSNAYHPDFEVTAQVTEAEWRFPSVGNPYIDAPNYRWWEQLLFCKLLRRTFEDEQGLDFLIEQIRR